MIAHGRAGRLATILAWLIVPGLLALVFFVPIAAAAIFLIPVAMVLVVNWNTQGKWKALRTALWQLFTGWQPLSQLRGSKLNESGDCFEVGQKCLGLRQRISEPNAKAGKIPG
jgi:hypothetical protein